MDLMGMIMMARMRVRANQLDLNAATRTTVISGFGGTQLKTQNEFRVNASILVFPYKNGLG